MGVFLVLINFSSLAEFLMRSSFIGFVVGIMSALIEYRKGE